ncbi:MAG: radical SAM protein [Eggerthellaceae bacterium]
MMTTNTPGNLQACFAEIEKATPQIKRAYECCEVCPRTCRVNRAAGKRGVCKAPAELRMGRAALHWWEEPCLVGDQGSGAVFFSYCPLGCVYCQNETLVAGEGIDVSLKNFARTVLSLQNEEHAANINLVTPSHYVPSIAPILRLLRKRCFLTIPVVYNTSSFDTIPSLQLMDGVVDCYLADFKYATPALAAQLSHAPQYPSVALAALDEMVRQVGEWREDDNGMLKRGVIVRHLVLPGHVEESLRVLEVLAERYGNQVRLSIMNQYTPLHSGLDQYGLAGLVSREEYERVLNYADDLGIEDYFWQEGGASSESFIPTFDGTGVIS